MYDAYLIPNDETCPFCGSSSYSKNGHTKTIINHTPYKTSLVKVTLYLQNYKCNDCGKTFRETNTFSNPKETISIESLKTILTDLLNPCATFSAVARDNHVKKCEVIELFDRYIDFPVIHNLPEIISFDEKHINKKLTCNAYAFVMLDFKTKKVIDLVVSRHKAKLRDYFKNYPKFVRDNVKFVTIDMWPTYRDITLEFFKNAKIVIDSFHVMKEINNALDKVRLSVMQKYNDKTDTLEANHPYYFVLKKYRTWLTTEKDNLTDKSFYIKKLNGWYNRDSLIKYMTNIDSKLEKGYELVSDYREFNKTCSYKDCEKEFDELVERFYEIGISSFTDVANMLTTWKEYILNSFIPVLDCVDENGEIRRLSNGPIEGTNLILEKINLNGNGYQNFWRFRNRVIFSVNKDVSQINHLVRKNFNIPKKKKKK